MSNRTENHLTYQETAAIKFAVHGGEIGEDHAWLSSQGAEIIEKITAVPKSAELRTQAFETAIADREDQNLIREAVAAAAVIDSLDAIIAEEYRIRGLLSADDILTTEWPEPVWAIPNILPAGLMIFAGKPKIGKSWLALQIAQAIAS